MSEQPVGPKNTTQYVSRNIAQTSELPPELMLEPCDVPAHKMAFYLDRMQKLKKERGWGSKAAAQKRAL
jgi:hypothetical protein